MGDLPGSAARAAARVDRDGRPFAVVVHTLDAAGGAALVGAVEAASRLADAHSQLRTQLQQQVDEVTRSRRRLLAAADVEARRLEEQLRSGPLRRLAAVRRRAAALRAQLDDGPVARALDAATAHAAGTLADLEGLASGLRPRDLDRGLPGALRALCERCPVPVTLDVGGDGGPSAPPDDVASTAYFVTAEALANVAKHARAAGAGVVVRHGEDGLTLVVTDDGRGGADPSPGTGLVGLGDRVAALGGTMTVRSPAGAGTELAAWLPWSGPGGAALGP